jgi:hypothetical protein
VRRAAGAPGWPHRRDPRRGLGRGRIDRGTRQRGRTGRPPAGRGPQTQRDGGHRAHRRGPVRRDGGGRGSGSRVGPGRGRTTGDPCRAGVPPRAAGCTRRPAFGSHLLVGERRLGAARRRRQRGRDTDARRPTGPRGSPAEHGPARQSPPAGRTPSGSPPKVRWWPGGRTRPVSWVTAPRSSRTSPWDSTSRPGPRSRPSPPAAATVWLSPPMVDSRHGARTCSVSWVTGRRRHRTCPCPWTPRRGCPSWPWPPAEITVWLSATTATSTPGVPTSPVSWATGPPAPRIPPSRASLRRAPSSWPSPPEPASAWRSPRPGRSTPGGSTPLVSSGTAPRRPGRPWCR